MKMDLDEIRYTKVTIRFPEDYARFGCIDEWKRDPMGHLDGNHLFFTWRCYGIMADLLDWDVPRYYLEGHEEFAEMVGKDVITPGIKAVSADISPVRHLLMELRRIGAEGNHHSMLVYKKDYRKKFLVDDLSILSDGGPFPRLLRIKQHVPKLLVEEPYQDLYEMAQHVDQDRDEQIHVIGSTLEEALERYVAILGMHERLRELYPKE